MPAPSIPYAPHFIPAPPTHADLDYADLVVIDLCKASTPQGRAELAVQVRDAMHDTGFFYVTNHGYSQEQVVVLLSDYWDLMPMTYGIEIRKNSRMFDIADVAFSQVSDEEKQTYIGKMKEVGSYQGYKLRQYWHVDNGVRDQIEHYNINMDVTAKQHPVALRPFMPEIDAFTQENHLNILYPLLRLLAVGLELPEDTFVKNHTYRTNGDTWLRFMKYFPLHEADLNRTKNVWMKGHTDFGSLTILWSQPVSALQIRSPDGRWRWVKHIENALVINCGEAMECWSGGFYKATIHRVFQPPEDQRDYNRLCVIYFALPDDNQTLLPYKESPVLQRHGIQWRFDEANTPQVAAWRRARVGAYGQGDLKKGKDVGVEEQIVNGVVVHHYN